jgi:hypothetical protein
MAAYGNAFLRSMGNHGSTLGGGFGTTTQIILGMGRISSRQKQGPCCQPGPRYGCFPLQILRWETSHTLAMPI